MEASRKTVCLLVGLIAMYVCTLSHAWALTWTIVDVETSEGALPNDIRYDASGTVHLLYHTDTQLKYASCSGQCGDTSRHWSRLTLWEGATKGGSLAVSPSGSVHVLFSLADDPPTGAYYTTCNGGCGNAANWSSPVFITDPSYYLVTVGHSSLVLDQDGRPRGILAGYDPSEYELFLYFIWCDAQDCLSEEDWSGIKIAQYEAGENWYLLDHSLDKNGTAYVATFCSIGFNYRFITLYSRYCLGECEDPSNWVEGPGQPIFGWPGPEVYHVSPARIRPDASINVAYTVLYPDDAILFYRSYSNPQGSDYYDVELGRQLWSTSLALASAPGIGSPPKPRIAALSADWSKHISPDSGLKQSGIVTPLKYLSCDYGCEQVSNWTMELVDPEAVLMIEPYFVWEPTSLPRISLNTSDAPGIIYVATGGPIPEEKLRYAFVQTQAPPWSLGQDAAAMTYGRAASEEGAKVNYLVIMSLPCAAVFALLFTKILREARRRRASSGW